MILTRNLILFLLTIGLISFNQIPDDLTALRPKHAPDSVTHRNKLDNEGKKWGSWQSYSRNGLLIMQMTYKDNKLNGEFIRFNGTTGKIIEKGVYLNDLKNGSFTKWYTNGVKRVEGSYIKGMKNGAWNYYFKNSPGITRLTGNFKDGKKNGKWVFYDKYETIRSIVEYDNGIITDSKELK